MTNFTDWQNLPLTLTPKDCMSILQLSKPLVYNLFNQESFPSVRVGKRGWRIGKDKFQEWFESQAAQPPLHKNPCTDLCFCARVVQRFEQICAGLNAINTGFECCLYPHCTKTQTELNPLQHSNTIFSNPLTCATLIIFSYKTPYLVDCRNTTKNQAKPHYHRTKTLSQNPQKRDIIVNN